MCKCYQGDGVTAGTVSDGHGGVPDIHLPAASSLPTTEISRGDYVSGPGQSIEYGYIAYQRVVYSGNHDT